MELRQKLSILADAAKYDASCASSGAKRRGTGGGIGSSDGTGICHSYTPDGRCVSLLKILLTNFCLYDCVFCVNRVSSDIPRARFTAEEVASLTIDFYRRNYIEGLFLSSGIFSSPDDTLAEMIRAAKLLRTTYEFSGYIHLKLIPGASPELVAEAGRWADRLSANIELPTAADLSLLAPDKTMEQVDGTMNVVRAKQEELSREPVRFAPAGQTTQMVVGATATSDREILTTATRLYDEFSLRRIYYSAFSPFPRADARLPVAPPPLVREHRLYQADWLMRKYGFAAAELTVPEAPDLPLDRDPKQAWAERNPAFFPVDVNLAPREALLRVPGMGHRNVDRILQLRRHVKIAIEHLRKLRVIVARAAPYIVTADHLPRVVVVTAPAPAAARQMSLFDADFSAVSGEL